MKKYRKIIAAIGFSMALMLSATANQPLLVTAATSGETKTEQTADTESAESRTEEIEIKDVQGFQELLKNCQYDSWSIGKTVRLVADIDISSLDFTGIAYFSGTFEGDGHVISHVNVSATGSDYGFFRYLGKNAVVNDLKLSGKVHADGSCENIGGVVGVNYGTVNGCSFTGTIDGKAAVGGIAGVNENSGKIVNCTSAVTITATDETGGIVGNNQGLVSGCTSESSVNTEELNTTMDLGGVDIGTLNITKRVIDRNDMGGIAGVSSGIITDCANQGTIGFDHTGYNVGGIAGRQSGKILNCTNEGAIYGRKDVGGIVGQAEPYIESEYLEDRVDSVQNSVKAINNSLSSMSTTLSSTSSEAKNYMTSISEEYKTSRKDLAGSLDDLSNSIGDNNPEAQEYLDHINDALNKMDEIEKNGNAWDKDKNDQLSEQWDIINNNLTNIRGTMSNSSESADDFVNDISDQLKAKDTNGDIDKLIETVDNGIQSVSNSVNNITKQISNIQSNVSDTMSVVTGSEDYIEDISSVSTARDTDGVISDSTNRGAVKGDLNVGGIVGTMNIEYDVDPEFDMDLTKTTNIALRSTVNCVVISCINYGDANAKKNCAGGITGLQELGLIYGSEGYGSVLSDAGSYAGGIVGNSASAVSDSYSLCNVEGKDYAGGIAGSGYTIRNCVAASTITGDGEAHGSIAGTVSDEGEVKANRFVNEELDGIDNINYSGVADEVSYEDIMTLEGIPEGFHTVTVTFKADDEEITHRSVAYNGSISADELPEIPEKDGYYASWPENITTEAVTENKTVEAEYTQWTESIAGEKRAENSKPLFLIAGKFYEDTTMKMEESDTDGLDEDAVYAYSWQLEHTHDKEYKTVTGHFYLTDTTGKNSIWYREAGSTAWTEAETTESGSYLVAELPYGASFALVHKDADYTVYYIGGGAAVVLLLVIMVGKRRRKRKAKKAAKKKAEMVKKAAEDKTE